MADCQTNNCAQNRHADSALPAARHSVLPDLEIPIVHPVTPGGGRASRTLIDHPHDIERLQSTIDGRLI